MGPDAAIPSDKAVSEYMPPQHIQAFRRAAGRFQAWILVRRGNPKSLPWIGKPGYIPKMVDCKAKTAEIDVNGPLSTAGLVASPVLLPNAFGPKKLIKALEEWNRFEERLYTFDPKTSHADDRAGKHYTIQTDKNHKHYGCVMYKPVFRSLAEYIHADYDLYAVAPAKDPAANLRVIDDRFSRDERSRSPMLYDVQYFLKAAGILPGQNFGTPIIRHGEQETFKTDWDDTLDVFWPDGKSVSELKGPEAIKRFYADTLGGRKQFGKDTVPEPAFGKWERT